MNLSPPYKRGKKLPLSYFLNPDTLAVAKDLIGKVLVTKIDGELTSGLIVESEAYIGSTDKACHAFGGNKTPRNTPMFHKGGIAYVYICYGIHDLFNIVTHKKGEPHAVLIRATQPLEGLDLQLERRGFSEMKKNISNGPGIVSKALGISKAQNELDLQSDIVWVEDWGIKLTEMDFDIGPRVGVGSCEEAANLPYRFRLKGNKFTGKDQKEY